ncbi:MAG: tetratricopeptide repeat protein [Bacteroidales bacterium]|nr:tetratricopeptide repeat protein [Bacteroidales bacterium]
MRRSILSLVMATLLLTGCSGLSKMKSASKNVRYQANPNPVETMDDKVVVKFTGAIPEKYFDKNCVMFIQPVFSWDDGNIPLEPLTLKGEKVDGDGTIINYANGGRFTYTDMFDFKPGMETGRVTLTPIGYKSKRTNEDARFADDVKRDNKGVEFTPVLLSDGVNNTSSWVDIKGNISISPINYNKKQGIVETADIYFLNGTSVLDWDFYMNRKFDAENSLQQLKRIMLEQGLPKQISITGWASPEGEESHNVGVSKNRADVATAQLNKILDEVLTIMARRAKVKPQDLEYYKYEQLKQLVITTRAAGEDWVHFVVMVEGSNIQDKHAIINIVETQQNLVKREQMIRNMAEVYGELNEEIFPNLRRAQIALYYSEARKTDAELSKLASLNPSKLSFDELMYAAYINYNYDTKMKYYKWATENHSGEWAAWNNAGAVAFYLGDYAEAERYLNVARDINPHNPDILNNTGLLCLAQKDYALAKYYFEEAKRQGSNDADANIPILNLKRGNYSEAEKTLKANTCSYNLAFAQLMNEETSQAIRTLDCCLDQNSDVNYLRAVAYARLGDKTNALKNLKASIDDQYDYKKKAAVDTEFKEYWDDEEFKLIVKQY